MGKVKKRREEEDEEEEGPKWVEPFGQTYLHWFESHGLNPYDEKTLPACRWAEKERPGR